MSSDYWKGIPLTNTTPAQQELQAAQALHEENSAFLTEKTSAARALQEELTALRQEAQDNAAKAAEAKGKEAQFEALIQEAQGASSACNQSKARLKRAKALLKLEELQDGVSELHIPTTAQFQETLQGRQEELDALVKPWIEEASAWDSQSRELTKELSDARKEAGRPLPGIQILGSDWDPDRLLVDTDAGGVEYDARMESRTKRMVEDAVSRWSAEKARQIMEEGHEEREAKEQEDRELKREQFEMLQVTDRLEQKEARDRRRGAAGR